MVQTYGIWSATDADAQKFKFVQNSDGTYQIRTKTSNDTSCVEIADASTQAGLMFSNGLQTETAVRIGS